MKLYTNSKVGGSLDHMRYNVLLIDSMKQNARGEKFEGKVKLLLPSVCDLRACN